MSREILFRGKRKDNGEWVEGFYTWLPVGSIGATIFANDDEIVCEDASDYIITIKAKQHSNYSNSYPLQVMEMEQYEIVPSTVCQYTGLTDRNGKKIFEGDILEGSLDDDYPENITGVVVKWDMFGYVLDQEDGSDPDPMDELDAGVWTVRGNVFDNPELVGRRAG